MDVQPTDSFRRRIGVAVGISLIAHVLLALTTGMLLRLPSRAAWVRKGEPLIVDLQSGEPEAPHGNPSSRGGAPGPPGPRPSKRERAVKRPAPSRRPSPRVAAVPAPRRPPAPVPAPKVASVPAPRVEHAPSPPPTPEAEPTPKPAAATPTPSQHAPSAVAKSPQEEAASRQPVQEARATPPASGGSQGRPGRIVTDIRSAMRGGGGGGGGPLGGLGNGHGGITGEPVPLDSTDPRFADYLDEIRRRITSKWDYPCVKNPRTLSCDYKSADLFIEFGILKSGKLQFIELDRTSGLPIYDDYALNAIKLASPFPPVPPGVMAMVKAGSAGIPIKAHFVYTYEVTFRTLLR